MTLQKRIYELLYYLIVGTVLAVAISVNMIAGTVVVFETKDIIVCSIIFLIAFYILFFNRYTIMITLGILAVSGIVAYFLFREGGSGADWFDSISYELNQILDFILGFNIYTNRFDFILGLAIVFLVAVIIGATIRNSVGFYVITVVGGFSIAIPAVNDWRTSELGIILFLFGFIILLLEKLNSFVVSEKGEGSGGSINAGYALMFLPLGVAVMVLSIFMSKPDVTKVGVVSAIRNSSFFFDESTVDITAFSEQQGNLGGPANLNDHFVMEVTTFDPNLKLAGHFYDNYSGTGWSKILEEQVELSADTEGVYAYNPYSQREEEMQNRLARDMVIREKTVVVNVYGKRTKNLYVPAFGRTISFGDKNGVSMLENGELSAEKLIPINGEYTQSYTGWNYSSGSLVYTLREGLKVNYGIDESYNTSEYERFLQLPPTVTPRVIDLAQQLTEGATNDYDKLKLIEAYLRTFPYTLEPPEVPQGAEFVDHFLFESQRGYCVYYATAMVVLGRSVGIPMRYVEGFVMPPYRNVNGNFSVTNKEAHAWPEAYIPGFGWLSFEPTAAYGAAGYTGGGGVGSEAEFTIPAIPPKEEKPVVDIENPEVQQEEITDPVEPLLPEEENLGGEGEITDPLMPKRNWTVIVISIILIALAITALILRRRYKRHRSKVERTTEKELREQVVDYFVYILNVLGGLGYHRGKGETAIDFAQRAGEGLEEPALTEVANLFSRVYYSENSVSKEEGESLKASYERLYVRLKKQRKSLAFLTNKYILLKY